MSKFNNFPLNYRYQNSFKAPGIHSTITTPSFIKIRSTKNHRIAPTSRGVDQTRQTLHMSKQHNIWVQHTDALTQNTYIHITLHSTILIVIFKYTTLTMQLLTYRLPHYQYQTLMMSFIDFPSLTKDDQNPTRINSAVYEYSIPKPSYITRKQTEPRKTGSWLFLS